MEAPCSSWNISRAWRPTFGIGTGPVPTGVGWELALLGLMEHLRDPTADVAAQGSGPWATSPEARAFYAQLAGAWGEAHVAAGAAEEKAAASAEHTRAFYSGEG